MVKLYDTTLRDGSQGEGISYSVNDKILGELDDDSINNDPTTPKYVGLIAGTFKGVPDIKVEYRNLQITGTASQEPTATATKPPIRAWEELVGRPKYHVMMFQAQAPIKAPKMIWLSTTEISMIPFPIVLATWSPKKRNATKLKNAAQITACCGERTRVETTVAMEFAESWKPFRKSNESASRIRKRIQAVMILLNQKLNG